MNKVGFNQLLDISYDNLSNAVKIYTPHVKTSETDTPNNTSVETSESDTPNKVSYCIIRDFNKINIQFDKDEFLKIIKEL
jgi:hypothetical protein